MHNVMIKSKQFISGETEVASGVQQFAPSNPKLLIFFFCWLKLSMMTPMNKLRVKKEPKMMKITK